MHIYVKFFAFLLLISLSFNAYFYSKLQNLDQQKNSQKTAIAETQSPQIKRNPFAKTDVITTTIKSPTDLANQYFHNRQFELAIELYSDIIIQDELAAEQLLNNWLKVLFNNLTNNDHAIVAEFTQHFFHYNAYHIPVMQLDALRLTQLLQYEPAILMYKNIIDNSFDTDIEEQSLTQIHLLAQKQFALLSQQTLWQEALTFINALLFDEPGYPPYLLLASHAKIELNQLTSAQEILKQLAAFDSSPKQVEILLKQVNQMLLGESAIPLIKQGAHYVVTGQFGISNSSVKLMIDTGASLSVLSQHAFDELPSWLSPVFNRQINMNTAGGIVSSSVYTFERFDIDGYMVESIEFAVLDLDSMHETDGLLGMSFLKHFKFQLDQQNNQLLLSYY